MNIKIGARIKELRKNQNVTQEQLATALGVTNQAISRWESESGYPDIEFIMPIANFFKVTANYLLDDGSNASLVKLDAAGGGEKPIHCSFCGKHHDDVEKVIAGPNSVCICCECVLLCVKVLISET